MVGPTDEQLDEIEARLDAATPGPWTLRVIDGSNVVTAGEYPMRSIIGPNRADLGFIANAPSDLRLLLAVVRRGRRIEAERDRAVELLIHVLEAEVQQRWSANVSLHGEIQNYLLELRAALDGA